MLFQNKLRQSKFKKCSMCGKKKSFSEYYTRSGRCTPCHYKASIRNMRRIKREDPDRYREYSRRFEQSKKGKEWRKSYRKTPKRIKRQKELSQDPVWRANKRKRTRKSRALWIKDMRTKICAIKLGKGCKICGYNKHPEALEFHHRDSKEKLFVISWAVSKCLNREAIFYEISKCDVLCSNCHRIKHAKRREYELKRSGS